MAAGWTPPSPAMAVARTDWLDLSTGINPVPYPVSDLRPNDWTALPDRAAMDGLLDAGTDASGASPTTPPCWPRPGPRP